MKIEEVIKNYADDLEYIEIRLERDCGDSKDYMKGMLAQARKTLSRNLGFADDSDRIMRPITRREKRTYTNKYTTKATSWDVALNRVYGITIEEGEDYEVVERPWAIIELLGKKYPVYADDAGQCDYIILDGERMSCGSYSIFPEQDLIIHILDKMYDRVLKKIEEKN